MVIGSSLSLFFLSVGEPDSPVLSVDEMKIEGNSFSVPLKQTDDGGTPLQHFNIRYKQVKDGVSLSLYVPFSTSSLVLVFPYCRPSFLSYALPLRSLRIKRGLSGKSRSCHLMLTPSPFKTCLSAQAINWKSYQSMLTVLLSPPRSTSPSQHNLVCGLPFHTPYTLAC